MLFQCLVRCLQLRCRQEYMGSIVCSCCYVRILGHSRHLGQNPERHGLEFTKHIVKVITITKFHMCSSNLSKMSRVSFKFRHWHTGTSESTSALKINFASHLHFAKLSWDARDFILAWWMTTCSGVGGSLLFQEQNRVLFYRILSTLDSIMGWWHLCIWSHGPSWGYLPLRKKFKIMPL